MEWDLEDGQALVKDVERILLVASIISIVIGAASIPILVALSGE